MSGLVVKNVGELQALERNAITALLDASPWSSAYQFPYAGDDLYFLVEQEGRLRFAGRASSGLLASRALPFLRVLAFNRGPAARTLEDMTHGLALVKQWARQQGYLSLSVLADVERTEAVQLASELEGTLQATGGVRSTLRLDLAGDDEALLQALPSSTRYKIRRAHKEGVTVRYGTGADDFDAFLGLHAAMMQRKSLGTSPTALLRALWQLRDDDPTRLALVLAEHEGTLLGANLLFRCGNRTEYLFGAVGKDNLLHGHVTAGYPLQWGGIRWARAAGCTQYDFGGFDPGLRTGPAHMKKAFFHTVQAVALGQRFDCDLQPVLPGLLRRLRRLATTHEKQE